MKHYWQGALTGVLTGLAIGYLTAPESGKKTRKKLGDTLNERTSGWTQGLKDQWDKTVSLAEELVTNVKAETGLFADKVQTKAEVDKK